MSRTYHHGKNRARKLRIRAIKRDKPDLKHVSHALIELAEAELEKEAQCEHKHRKPSQNRRGGSV
jgi:hypothetical protein